MMINAVHGFVIPPKSEMTLDGYTCSECDFKFAVGRIHAENIQLTGVGAPRYCPGCGKAFDRIISFNDGHGKREAHT